MTAQALPQALPEEVVMDVIAAVLQLFAFLDRLQTGAYVVGAISVLLMTVGGYAIARARRAQVGADEQVDTPADSVLSAPVMIWPDDWSHLADDVFGPAQGSSR